MAWAVIVLSVVKMAVVLIRPRWWLEKVSKPFYTDRLFFPITLIAVIAGFWYLTRELTVVQIFASFFVVMFLFSLSLRPYARELFAAFEGSVNDRSFMRKSWPVLAMWMLLVAWGAYYLIRY